MVDSATGGGRLAGDGGRCVRVDRGARLDDASSARWPRWCRRRVVVAAQPGDEEHHHECHRDDDADAQGPLAALGPLGLAWPAPPDVAVGWRAGGLVWGCPRGRKANGESRSATLARQSSPASVAALGDQVADRPLGPRVDAARPARTRRRGRGGAGGPSRGPARSRRPSRGRRRCASTPGSSRWPACTTPSATCMSSLQRISRAAGRPYAARRWSIRRRRSMRSVENLRRNRAVISATARCSSPAPIHDGTVTRRTPSASRPA